MPRPESQERERRAGLCASCKQAERIVSSRGSEFWLCRRSRVEPGRFRKYPPLPKEYCDGWEATEAAGLTNPLAQR